MSRHVLSTEQEDIYDLTRVVEKQFNAIAIFDIEGNCLYNNLAFTEFIGPLEGHASYRFQSLIDDPQTTHEIQQKINANQAWSGTARIQTAEQDVLAFLTATPIDEPCSQFFVILVPMARITADRRAWTALQESEDNYRRLVNLSPNLIMICVQGKIRYINPGGLKILRATRQEEILGRSIYDFIQLEDHAMIQQRLQRMKREGASSVSIEEHWLRLDGTPFDMGLTILPFDNKGEEAVQLIGSDITERTQVHEQLRQYTRQLLALNMIGLAMVSSLQTSEVLDQVTQNLRDILGASTFTILLNQTGEMVSVASSGENAGYYIGQRFPEISLHRFKQLYRDESFTLGDEGMGPELFMSRFPEKSMFVVPLKQGGELMGMLCAHYPSEGALHASEHELLESAANWVTVALQNARLFQNERKQHQLAEALLESASAINRSQNLSEVLDLILQQVWKVLPCSAANIMILENDKVRVVSHLGYENRAGFYETVKSFCAPLNEYPLLKECIECHQPFLVSDTGQQPHWVHAIGGEWILSYASAPLFAGDRVYGFLNLDSDKSDYFNQDMLQRLQAFAAQASIAIRNAELVETLQNALQQEKQIRAQMVQSEKLVAMGRVVASMAHELNNPLQTIRNCLFILQNEAHLPEDMQEYLETGLSEIGRLTDIVGQLRGVYRPRTEGGAAPIQLVGILEYVRNLLKLELQRKKVDCEIHIDNAKIQVTAVPDQLRQVFLNISQNAIQAMEPDGGKLWIEVQQHADTKKVEVKFSDTGKGILPEDLPHIFDPFFTTRETGFGLGLALCQDMITNHGGTIEVKSAPGEGTSFTVWLPDTTIN